MTLSPKAAVACLDWSEGPVPSRFTGLWRRLSIEFGDGSGDIDAFVVWLQTEDVFIDLRIPARPGGRNPTGFADLTPRSGAALAAQEGFAGRLLWTEDRAAWPRALDFRPTGVPDEGWVARTGRVLVETGVHARYVEHWWQAIDRAAPLAAFGRLGSGPVWARAGEHVMFAQDRRAAPPAPGGLGSGVAAAAGDPAALAALLDCEISYGAVDGGSSWRVARSTLPWLEGEIRALPPDLTV